MTRRLILAILATTLAALLLAGLGTIVLATAAARRTTEADLRAQATDFVTGFEDFIGATVNRPNRPAQQLAAITALKRALHLDGFEIMLFGPAGHTNDVPPAGLSIENLHVDQLLAGNVVSGHQRGLVYAAAPSRSARGTAVVVLTRETNAIQRPAFGWFLVASAITLVAAALVAVWLGRRLTRPVREAAQATHRIADGDLATRLPDPPPGDRDELAELARSINRMAGELERSRGLEQQFLLSVSHDLRTPLTSIRGYAEAISDGATKDPAWAAGVILSEARRLERLVADLLDLAHLRARSFSLSLQPVDLSALATEAVAARSADTPELSVAVQVPPDRVLVLADRDRLAQVVANLVDNATKFASQRVVVGVAGGGQPMVWVDDDGPGIAPADLPHVFERLYVARHAPVRKESGSGLGLAIVAELVAAMGGTVVADTAPGGGARLVVQLTKAAALTPPPPPVSAASGR
jgi:two-component system, OmpR family, sensor kinase